jgi:hypothetical protein
MSLHITFFTPKYHSWRGSKAYPRRLFDAWFYRPDEHSSGGAGFKVPFLQVCFMWGHR